MRHNWLASLCNYVDSELACVVVCEVQFRLCVDFYFGFNFNNSGWVYSGFLFFFCLIFLTVATYCAVGAAKQVYFVCG